MMAEATGKLTGRPGICFATRGPGAANAMAGVYIAERDATPMILFVGLPSMRLEDQSPFQDMDLEALVRAGCQMGHCHPFDRPHPRIHRPRLPRRHVRPARPGRDRPARKRPVSLRGCS